MDSIGDLLETSGRPAHHDSDNEYRQRWTAVWIAVLAVLLAVAGLGGENTSEDIVYNNIMSSDTFAWYQAKNTRQTFYALALDELRMTLELQRESLTPTQLEELEARIDNYLATIARYESEPDPAAPDDPQRGEGKAQLLARALMYQTARDEALSQEPNFDYAVVLFQIAIVLASVSLIASSRWLLTLSATMGVIGTLLTINGYMGFIVLPF